MKIYRHRHFIKEYKKLDCLKQKRVNDAIKLFYNDPLDPKLRIHLLKGKYKNLYSMDAGFDLRIIF